MQAGQRRQQQRDEAAGGADMRDAGQRAAFAPRVQHALQRVQVWTGLPFQLDRGRRGRQPARQPGEQRAPRWNCAGRR